MAGGAEDDGQPGESVYTLGDNRLAGDRLALLAQVFGPTTRTFLADLGTPTAPLSVAVDLGCGTGHTTQLVADAVGIPKVVGLDASTNFVERARAAYPDLEFVVHDATATPFPTPPAALIFARYLLTHLPRTHDRLSAWGSQLAPGGRLLVEDVEAIDTEVTTFADYLHISGSMMANHHSELYVGRVIARFDPDPSELRVVESRQAFIVPATAVVARIFRMNMATWRHDPWVRDNVSASVLDDLDADLHRLYESTATGEIRWTHRQIAYERPG